MDEQVRTETKNLSRQDIETLRADPSNVICDVEYTKIERVLTMQEVRELIQRVRVAYNNLRMYHPHDTDEQLRDKVCENVEGAQYMRDQSHPKLFTVVTDRRSSDEELRQIANLILLRERVEKGEMSEEESFAHAVQVATELKQREGKK